MNKVLFYNTYTEKYMEGLPTGNGRLAAMMLGTPEKLRIALNHEWMWRGENRFREQEDVSCHIGEVRELLLAGDFYKGTELANEYFGGLGGISGIKNRVDPYQPVGDLYVTFDAGEISDYTRSLSLESGLSSTSFNSKYGRISEDLFVSMADGCMVLKISSELSSNFSVKLTRIFDPLCTISYEDISDGLVMKGSFKDGISFEAHIKINKNGTFVKDNSSIGEISVKDASETLVLINIGTGSQVSVGTAEFYDVSGSIELRPCVGDTAILVGSGLCGGRAYAMLEKFYREVAGSDEAMYGMMAAQALDFKEKSGVTEAWKVKTTFSGTRSNPDMRGSIANIGVENFHPGAMTLGMIQGILEELYEMYEKMCGATGKKATKLVGSGNGIRKNKLMQELAEEMYGMKIEIPLYQEEAAYGAALYSLVAAGLESDFSEVQKKIKYC